MKKGLILYSNINFYMDWWEKGCVAGSGRRAGRTPHYPGLQSVGQVGVQLRPASSDLPMGLSRCLPQASFVQCSRGRGDCLRSSPGSTLWPTEVQSQEGGQPAVLLRILGVSF